MSKHDDVLGHYSDVFKTWQTKLVGAKPARDALATVHGLKARPGKQALATAMAMRDCGVTGSEIVIACGAPQLNKMRGFIIDGLLKREAVPPRNGHTVYKLTLTAKGAARVKSAADKPEAKAKAEKPVKVSKPKAVKKPKAKPVPVSEPVAVQVTEPGSEPVAVQA